MGADFRFWIFDFRLKEGDERSGGGGAGFGLAGGQKAVEDAVDKGGRLGGPEPLGQLDRLVDGHSAGRFGVQDFKGPHPQHVAVGGGHPLQAPVVGRAGQQGIELRPIAADARDQRPGEIDQFRGVQPIEPRAEEAIGLARIVSGIQVVLKQHLQGDFACPAAATHEYSSVCGQRRGGVAYLSYAKYALDRGNYRTLWRCGRLWGTVVGASGEPGTVAGASD
jgi:hypothetical protein